MKSEKTILLTGVAGFIGMHVARALLGRADVVIGVDNINDYYDPNLKQARLDELKNFKSFTFHKGDIADKDFIEEIFEENDFDSVIHLAAQAGVRYSLENPHAYIHSNIVGTQNILESILKHDVDSLVFASSSSVYGDNKKVPFSEEDKTDSPRSLYGATKKACEIMCYSYHSMHGINMTGLRYFTVYGPWGRPDMALFKFTKAILEDEKIDVYNQGEMSRDFTYIDDIVTGTVAAIDSVKDFQVINLGNDTPVSLIDFISEIESATGKEAQKNMMDMQKGDVVKTHADISKAKQLLRYDPSTPLSEGVPKFVEWYKDYYGK